MARVVTPPRGLRPRRVGFAPAPESYCWDFTKLNGEPVVDLVRVN